MLAFAEACFGIGIFVSGLFLATVSIWLYSSNIVSLWHLLPTAYGGAFAGDHLGFYLGRWLGGRFHQLRLVKKHQAAFYLAEQTISKRGGVAIFIGRLIPAIRSLVPAVLGVSNFAPRRFSALDSMACLVWMLGLGAIVIGVDNLL